jgi:hypothetical protein
VVLEHHGHVTGTVFVDAAQPSPQEMSRAHALIAVLAIGPAPFTLAKQHLALGFRLLRARLDLRSQRERRL